MKVLNWCKMFTFQISDKQVRDAIAPCLQIKRVALRIQMCKLNSSFIQQVTNYDSQISIKSVFGYHSATNISHVVMLQGCILTYLRHFKTAFCAITWALKKKKGHTDKKSFETISQLFKNTSFTKKYWF